MLRNALLFVAGVLSMLLILLEWPIVVPVLHVLFGV